MTFISRAISDGYRLPAAPRRRPGLAEDALERAIAWLCQSHDVTGRRGSAAAYSYRSGWRAAYPETSGYIVGTLLEFGLARDRSDLIERAQALADWEVEVQGEDGGVMEGVVTTEPKRTIVFNTGMVLHGWLDLDRRFDGDTYLAPAIRAGSFLVRNQDADGAWRGEHSFNSIPHTYHARVAWALLRLGEATGSAEYREAAIRNLDWVVSKQRPNGWFDDCIFRPNTVPSTHGIAYTLRGLVESYALVGDDRYLQAAQRTSSVLIDQLRANGRLAGLWDENWSAAAGHECLTGTVQLGGVWLRIGEITGESGYDEAGRIAVEHGGSFQWRSRRPEVDGALPGSFPVWGAYARMSCPNWATKFLADALMMRAALIESAETRSPTRIWPS